MDLDHRKMTLIEKVDALTISHEGVEHTYMKIWMCENSIKRWHNSINRTSIAVETNGTQGNARCKEI